MRFLGSKLARRVTAGASAFALLASIGASGVLAGGPPGLAFYVDDARYRTVGTPTDFFGTGAPDSSFDRIYALGSGLINVAESKPGDTDYNGGRWQVLPITWATDVTPVQYTNDWQILQAESDGLLTIGAPVKEFLCPVIPVQGSKSGH
ncbi:MAG: hypothetical protein ABIR64_10240 [Candidatus Limnocylindrales bacterium]